MISDTRFGNFLELIYDHHDTLLAFNLQEMFKLPERSKLPTFGVALIVRYRDNYVQALTQPY